MTARKHPILSRPRDKSSLVEKNNECRRRVIDALTAHGKSINWLARAIESNGIACPASITHWASGRQASIGCGIYDAILDVLDILDETKTDRINNAQQPQN